MLKKSKFIGFSVICALITSISSTSAYAYSTFGGQWNSTPVRYAIDAPTSYVTPIEEAADMWTDNTNFSLKRSNSSQINIYADYYGRVDWDGTSRMNGGTDFSGDYSYGYVMINQTFVDSYTNLQEKLIVAHELGHELGLAHTSNNRALMYGTSSGGNVLGAYSNNHALANAPSADDIAGANSIY